MSRSDWRAFRAFGRCLKQLWKADNSKLSEGAQQQVGSIAKWNEAAEDAYRREIISAVKAIAEQQKRANDQAESERRLTRILEFATVGGIWGAAAVAIWAIYQSSNDSQGQRTVMQRTLDEMRADERAWIKVETVDALHVDKKFGPDGLQFRGSAFPAFMPLRIVVKNVGRGTALNVRVGAWPIIGNGPHDLLAEEEKHCAGLDTWPTKPMLAANTENPIAVLFPGDEPPPIESVALAIVPSDWTKYQEKGRQNRLMCLVGCARYTLPGSSTPHESGFAYHIIHLTMVPPPLGRLFKFAQTPFTPFENVPADRLKFEVIPLAAGPTN